MGRFREPKVLFRRAGAWAYALTDTWAQDFDGGAHLKLTVVAADGQDVRPVEVDEIQIANAETFDVIVEPKEDRAYTIVAEASDRSGMGHATLAPRAGMVAPVPPLRARREDGGEQA